MEITKIQVGNYAPDFELPGVDGEVHHLSRYLERFQAVVVVFMCNHCPYVQAYLERLKAIQTDYAPRVTLIGLNPNDDKRFPEDSFEQMKLFAQEKGINFPYLRDTTQEVALGFGAERTPEVYVLDHEGIVHYNGRIDDNFQDASLVNSQDLRQALEELLSTGKVTGEMNQAVGCSVKWRS